MTTDGKGQHTVLGGNPIEIPRAGLEFCGGDGSVECGDLSPLSYSFLRGHVAGMDAVEPVGPFSPGAFGATPPAPPSEGGVPETPLRGNGAARRCAATELEAVARRTLIAFPAQAGGSGVCRGGIAVFLPVYSLLGSVGNREVRWGEFRRPKVGGLQDLKEY